MTQLQTENEVAVSGLNNPKPPEGFISFNDFIEQNPGFCSKYEGNKEAHMAIWLDEPVDASALVSRRNSETGRVAVETVVIKSRTSATIKVSDFINWFGDPKLKLHRESFPSDIGYDAKFWRKMKNEKLRIFGRENVMKGNANGRTFTSPEMSHAQLNTDHNLWGKYPRIYVLLPDKMVMSIQGDDEEKVDPIAYVWEAMNTIGVAMNSERFEETEIIAVQENLLQRASELNIEGVFGSSATGTIIEGFMITAKEKYGQ